MNFVYFAFMYIYTTISNLCYLINFLAILFFEIIELTSSTVRSFHIT